MKMHMQVRGELLLATALSEKKASPGLTAALEFLALKDGDRPLLNVYERDSLIARLAELGRTPNGVALVQNPAMNDDDEFSEYEQFIQTRRGRLWRSMRDFWTLTLKMR